VEAAAVKVGPFKRPKLGRNNLNEMDIQSLVGNGTARDNEGSLLKLHSFVWACHMRYHRK
jgi:hypothetical protein